MNCYGLDLKHFKDETDKTVIYYGVCYSKGNNIGRSRFYFFQYNKDRLIPVLTEIQWNFFYLAFGRAFGIAAEIVNERPLQLKFTYENQFCFYYGSEPEILLELEFFKDSTVVSYHWDSQTETYTPDFNGTKLNRNKMLSYYPFGGNDILFVNTHYDLFINGLNGNDEEMRKAILIYLDRIYGLHIP